MKAVLIFGSCTGKTEYVADMIVDALKPEFEIELKEVSSVEPEDFCEFEFAICGIPTWDIGELEYGWQDIYDKIEGNDLSKLTIAMFGLGDQADYADTYQDAMGMLYEKLLECGATGNLGFISTDGHEFEESKAVIEGKFCGLALDEDNQDDLTDDRIKTWANQLKNELKIGVSSSDQPGSVS